MMGVYEVLFNEGSLNGISAVGMVVLSVIIWMYSGNRYSFVNFDGSLPSLRDPINGSELADRMGYSRKMYIKTWGGMLWNGAWQQVIFMN